MNAFETKGVRPIFRIVLAAVSAGALVAAHAGAGLAADAADICESGKNRTVGKYASCMFLAQSKYVRGGSVDAAGYTAAIDKCERVYSSKWQSSEEKAAGMCPSNGDEARVQDFLDACIVSTEDALGGGVLPLDVIDCNAKIGTLKTGETTGAQRGVAREFTDNGDGTITDDVTGLMWEKKSDDGSVHDKDNLYSWSTGADFGAMNGTMITAFLSTLNAGSGFAGYTDWRIPNRNELLSLTDLGAIIPSTFRPEFNDACTAGCTVSTCSCTSPGVHWSSSQRNEFSAWYVDFEYGFSVYFLKTNGASVRAVRGGA